MLMTAIGSSEEGRDPFEEIIRTDPERLRDLTAWVTGGMNTENSGGQIYSGDCVIKTDRSENRS